MNQSHDDLVQPPRVLASPWLGEIHQDVAVTLTPDLAVVPDAPNEDYRPQTMLPKNPLLSGPSPQHPWKKSMVYRIKK